VRIAVDAMGGDLAPKAAIEGAVDAARDFGVEIVLVGAREIVESELTAHDTSGLAIRVEHAPETVTMEDSPLESVLAKPHSSIHLGLELVKRGDVHGFVSAGNSGAVMAAAMAILGTLPHVERPGIASLVPTSAGLALLIDAGANTEVKPIHLAQFAVMGTVYCRRVRGIARPRVGILSNGEESSKGTDLTRAAAEVLKQMAGQVNYIGYVEGRDINRAKADVVVTDGFTGNVALKTMEGFAAFLLGHLREIFSSSWRGRLAYLLLRKSLRTMREQLDPHEYGGAPLLGVNGVAIVAHGSSNARALRNAIHGAANEALVRQVNAEIADVLARSEAAMSAKPPTKRVRGLFARMREKLRRTREAELQNETHKTSADSADAPAAGAVAHESPASAEHKAADRESGHPAAPARDQSRLRPDGAGPGAAPPARGTTSDLAATRADKAAKRSGAKTEQAPAGHEGGKSKGDHS
jgi:phosphate acyltransferase